MWDMKYYFGRIMIYICVNRYMKIYNDLKIYYFLYWFLFKIIKLMGKYFIDKLI